MKTGQELNEDGVEDFVGRIKGVLKQYPFIHVNSAKDEWIWKILEEEIDELPEQYQWESIHYQTAYFTERCNFFMELSLIIQSGPHNIGIWPLCIEKNNGEWRIGSCGGEILAPLFISEMVSSSKTKRKNYRLMLNLLLDISGLLDIPCIRFSKRMLCGGG